MTSRESAGTPSRFWQRLGEEHERAATTHGVDAVKRHQALRYFTFRYQWSRLPLNPQARFLLWHSTPRAWARALSEPIDVSDEAWEGIEWSRRERRLYTIAVRLLWQYAQRRGDPLVMALDEPAIGRPLPVRFGGRTISQDLANSGLEVASIGRVLGDRVPKAMLEVGAGYGRSAYALLHRYHTATYTIVDIEPALSMSKWYLGQLFPPERLSFVPASDVEGLGDGEFDLALSISSLQEMTEDQIELYTRLFDRIASGGHVYLKQWTRRHNRDNDVAFRFSRMPIPTRWDRLFRSRCAVQTTFTEAGWLVPASVRSQP